MACIREQRTSFETRPNHQVREALKSFIVSRISD
jgi:hypothetical protein